jgi:hypothetical protein
MAANGFIPTTRYKSEFEVSSSAGVARFALFSDKAADRFE